MAVSAMRRSTACTLCRVSALIRGKPISICPATMPGWVNSHCRLPSGPARDNSRYSSKPMSTVGSDSAVCTSQMQTARAGLRVVASQ